MLTLGLISLGAAALRFGTLPVQSLWLDEVLSTHTIRGGLAVLPTHVLHGQTSPPLYFVLARVWGDVLGTSPTALRAFSALCGALLVPVMYLAARPLGETVGLWAAALTAASGELFYFSQEIRGYALFVLLVAIAFVLWQRALADPVPRNLLAFSAVSTLALLTHYFGAPVFLFEMMVLARRVHPRVLAGPAALYLAIAVVLAPLAVAQNNGKLSFIGGTSLPTRVAEGGKELITGPYGPFTPALQLACGAIAVAVLVAAWRGAPGDFAGRTRDMALVAAGTVALPIAVALVGIGDFVLGRNLLGAAVPMIILLAAGCTWSPSGGWLGGALCIALLAIAIGTVVLPAYRRDDWRDAATALGRPVSAQRLLVSGRYGATPLSFYLPAVSPGSSRGPLRTQEIDVVFLRRAHGGPWEPGEDSLSAALAPASPVAPPPVGFRLFAKHRTAAYAVYRFRSARLIAVRAEELRSMMGDASADIAVQTR